MASGGALAQQLQRTARVSFALVSGSLKPVLDAKVNRVARGGCRAKAPPLAVHPVTIRTLVVYHNAFHGLVARQAGDTLGW